MAMENPFSIAMLVYRSVLLKKHNTLLFFPPVFNAKKSPRAANPQHSPPKPTPDRQPMLELRRSCLNSIESV